MADYIILTKPNCPHCTRAKQLLTIRGLAYVEEVYQTPEQIEYFKAQGHRTFPQIWEGRQHIGGADQLETHLRNLAEVDDF